MKNYKKLIEENKSDFIDSEQLEDFIDSYAFDDNEVDNLEGDISEFADGLVPIYYHKIVKEWAETPNAHELTKDVIGEYDKNGDIYKMMQSDLYFYYESILNEDYNKFLELLDE